MATRAERERESSVNLTKTFPDVFSPGRKVTEFRAENSATAQQHLLSSLCVCREIPRRRRSRSRIASHKVTKYRIPLLCDKKRRSRTLSGFRYIGYDGNLERLHCEHGSALVLIGHEGSSLSLIDPSN